MSEKIKVTIPEVVYQMMLSDAESFRIVKGDGTPNLNAFINRLIVNFYEDFAAEEDALRRGVREALSGVPERYLQEAYDNILHTLAKREKETLFEGASVAISFKPTKQSERVVIYIENVLLQNESLASFYRRLFIAYAKQAKNAREKLIHKGVYEVLTRAIREGLSVCLALDGGQVYPTASIYSVDPGRDELFNFVLFYNGRRNTTVRLSKIKSASLLTSAAVIPEENAAMFARQTVCGAQYPIYSTDDEPIRVQLTNKGKALFQRIYLYRPTPISIEGDIYTFNCSANQLMFYLKRFGSEALILHPKKLGIDMMGYYYFALKKYRTLYGRAQKD